MPPESHQERKMFASTCTCFTVISRPRRVFFLAAHLKIFDSRKHRGARFITPPLSLDLQKRVEAEQSSYYREYPVVFGQKWEILGVGQSDTADNTLCRYCFQWTSVFGHKAPGAPVFGHCPKIFVRTAKLKLIPRFDPTSHASFIPSIVVVIPRLRGGGYVTLFYPF